MKKSFVLYNDLINTTDKLSDEQTGILLKRILEYVNGNDTESTDQIVEIVFVNIKLGLIRNHEKYEQRAEIARENGQKGGRPKENPVGYEKTQSVNSKPRKPVNVNVSVSDSVSVNDNVSETILKKRKPKRTRHVFSESIYHENEELFFSDWEKTKTFEANPTLNTKKIFDAIRLSEEKYKYTNWIRAAEKWVLRDISQFQVNVTDILKQDPAYFMMNKGEKQKAELELKRELRRNLITQPSNTNDDEYLPF